MTDDRPEPAGQQPARRLPGTLAAQVLQALVDAGSPLTPGEVRDLLDTTGALSYSTVVTTLTRLHEKEVVTRERDGRAFRYSAVADPPALTAWRMGRLLESEEDHGPVLARFVDSLSAKDEQLLRQLLGELDK
ncbi:BlaI/MecI/CopY family transcriptional regulator [Lentzea sp. NPDC058436]|uniref:BlaI/MecI/CopY family transcriptional regulator n=1 Tax=Lentzea sp. NPDC058436 TaxID=3346499 RepID=UPI0036664918